MNYNEFIAISKESMNDITFDVYSKEIEPCYNEMPEINGDSNYSKADFIKWWKNNRNLAMWISGLITASYENNKQLEQKLVCTKEAKEKLEDENERLYIALEKKDEEVDKAKKEMLDVRMQLLEKIEELELKIAFTPDAIVREIRWEFFEHYEERKQDAISRGIIRE